MKKKTPNNDSSEKNKNVNAYTLCIRMKYHKELNFMVRINKNTAGVKKSMMQ